MLSKKQGQTEMQTQREWIAKKIMFQQSENFRANSVLSPLQ